MKTLAIAIAAGLLFVRAPAQAQWLYQGQESAFGDDTLHVALTASGSYGFGLRCKAGTIEAVYTTPDKSFDADGYKLANALKPLLRIRIDDQGIVELAAELHDSNGSMVVLAEVERSLLDSVRDARRRVAVVVQLLGDRYHERSFNVRGSTAALNKLIAGCDLPE